MNDYEKAIEALEQMKKYSKSKKYQDWYYFRVGYIYWLMGKDYKVLTIQNFMDAVKHETTFGQAYGYLAEVYVRRNEFDKATMLLKLGTVYAKDYADYNNDNIFWKLYQIYMYHQRYKDALNIALQTADHTSYSWLKRESLEHVATAAMHLRDFKMAYEYYSRYANALMAEGKEVPHELKELIEGLYEELH